MYSARLVITLDEIAQRFAPVMQRSIVDVLSQPRYTNTGAGVGSVTVEVIPGDESKSPALKVLFADHLVFLNQRRIEWSRLPDIAALTTWAETKTSNREAAERLAWAVAWDKRKNDTWKPKLWRKRSLSEVLKDMNEQLIRAYDEAIEADLQESAKGG
jgi:hypothetical protein